MIKRIPVLVLMTILFVTGCTPNEEAPSENVSTQQIEQNNLDNNEKEDNIEYNDNDNQDDNNDINDKNDDNNESTVQQVNQQVASSQSSEFKLYKSNENADGIVEVSVSNINYEKSVDYNLQELANMVSKECFNDEVTINVVDVDEENIATIDLIDEQVWSSYFQGSAGAEMTREVLLSTFLQKDYDGEWIDGVKFLVDGQENLEFDHISFDKVFMRK